MNIVRGLSKTGDWTFGLGTGGYLAKQAMVGQNIKTRIQEVVGDCFFNLGAGIDRLLYAQKNVLNLDLAIRGIILGTNDVVGLAAISSVINAQRQVTFTYSVVTIYGTIADTYTYSIAQGNP